MTGQVAADLHKVFRPIVNLATSVPSLPFIGSFQHRTTPLPVYAMLDARRQLEPASLKWQEDGELAAQDVFNLVCRLRAVESGETSNELWRLVQKYPSRSGTFSRYA